MSVLLCSVFLLLTAIGGCGGLNYGRWCASIENDMNKCKEEFLMNLNDLKKVYSKADTTLDINTLSPDRLSGLCGNGSALEGFYDCFYEKLFSCLPEEWHKILPGADKTKAYIEFLCKNINDMDVSCVKGKNDRLIQCAVHRGLSVSSSSSTPEATLATLCSVMSATIDCVRPTYASCSEKTINIITKAYEYQRPAACNACTSGSSLLLLLLCVLIVGYSHSYEPWLQLFL